YECPMLCGEVMLGMLESFNQLQLVMGKDYEVVTVSFAAGETHELAAAKKKNLVRGYSKGGAADGWHFLTGKKENIDKLADTVGFGYSYDEQSKQYAHAGGIMVLTPSGKLSRYLFGIDYPSKDLRFALIEASEGRVGSMAEQLLMLCYHYDPSTGTYSFAVMRALQILGPLTVILIGGLMWLLFRIERRKQREEASPETGHKPVLGG
ncbi:MAG: SCO family protein, partial [Candidatus Hydrogenedentes bacterium]|nr:SCO family protein [Candidatus Hydrogenedentota bacterium]